MKNTYDYTFKKSLKEICTKYNEKHRYYHNFSHIINMTILYNKYSDILSNEDYYTLYTAILFHDIVYNPKSNTNEEDSVKEYLKYCDNPKFRNQKVIDLILATKKRELPSDPLEQIIWKIDNDILLSDFPTLLEYEEKIFKEFQYADYELYKINRIKFLENTIANEYFNINADNLKKLIEYIEYKKVKIGVYVGSFNPFTIGHLNILQKAEKIFDKVIILYAQNSEKNLSEFNIPSVLEYHQVEILKDKLTTDFIKNKTNSNVDISLIRGLRNGTDLQYEQNQLAFMKDMYEDLKVVYITCDKEFEHISSSAVRNIQKIDISLANKYLA